MKKCNRWISLCLALVLTLSFGMTALAAGDEKPILALGADLSSEQKATVLKLLEIDGNDLADYDVITVTNQEEHQYLDAYLSSSVIGTKALSSVLIRPAEEGAGLNVSTYNISYCTIDMYTNALLTAGLEDADVYVAGPSNISGTSALIGAVKGYAEMNGSKVDEQALETAVNELVVTGELGDSLGDSETASDMIAYIKQQIIEQGVSSDADIETIIRNAMKEFNINLTDEQVKQLVELMNKISKLDIDVDALSRQAGQLYDKLKGMGLNLDNIDTEKVGNFITRFFDSIMNLVNKLIG
ncbi:DUF1002 domain-containing protein [Anaerosacchariphilus sp. NSJ-68]|uniref:DUF1002 domain-containing protein n=2 Tax=Lachnospiraceae TaxID=186803 RepID=A0A923LE95_9FIRM|nr:MULTISPECIES: DUF1002 domain-containing protein [Lachnospiraceae]MBC5660706.1 DUF1002 domain-containing protein [Anaerosacchariphilus hominis]MBC5697928.1 DUF1002 domain-containing protein [Roseburia difficilis]